jgi:hypothetical protein
MGAINLPLTQVKIQIGGILVAEECVAEACFSYPPSPAYQKWLILWNELLGKDGKDNNIGNKLHTPVLDLNCQIIHTQLSQAVLQTPKERSIVPMILQEWKLALVEKEIASISELDALMLELQQLETRQDVLMGGWGNVLIAGKKI